MRGEVRVTDEWEVGEETERVWVGMDRRRESLGRRVRDDSGSSRRGPGWEECPRRTSQGLVSLIPLVGGGEVPDSSP